MPFDPNSLLYLSLIFFIISTIIQILVMWRAKAKEREDLKLEESILPKYDSVESALRKDEPLIVEKVDEQTFRKIDRIMKDGY